MTGSDEWATRWQGLAAATISDCLDRLHAMDAGIHRISGHGVLGPAFTIETCAGDSATIHRALEVAPAGSVLVIDAGGHLGRAVWGNVLTVAAQHRGVRGVVLDGVVRDVDDLRAAEFPVFARGACPAGPHKGFAGRWGATVQCGGVVVATGDVVVGDADGVVVVPGSRIDGLPEAVRARVAEEERWISLIREGSTTATLLGLTGAPDQGQPTARVGD
ncbi:MAG: hypothetical protein GEU96_11950 [Propionibacteriales bacterium]|nr:hypothetical protein [Propionibacteriales bacterium]